MQAKVGAFRLGWALALSGAVVAPAPAWAQVLGPILDTEIPFDLTDPERPTVLERDRPEIAPLGVPAGGFLLFPELEITPGYTSNVFGASTEEVDDGFLFVSPALTARSRWSRYMLNAHARGNFRRYLSNPVRNLNGYNAYVEGRFGLATGSNIYGQVRSEKTEVAQYAGDFPANAARPVPLNRRSAILRGTYQGGMMRLIGNVDVNRLDYSNTTSLSGDVLDQNSRDRTIWRFSGRAEYRLDSARVLFAQGTYTIHDFTTPTVGQPNRTGSETRILAGAAFHPTPLIRARIALGYLWRRYDDPSVSGIKGIAADLQADYLVTRLTTISLAARREAQDSITRDSPGFIATRVQGRVDHELLRNLLLHAGASFERDKFVDTDRRDTLYRLEAGARYTPFRNVALDPTSEFIKRDSKGAVPGQRFDELRIVLRTTLRF